MMYIDWQNGYRDEVDDEDQARKIIHKGYPDAVYHVWERVGHDAYGRERWRLLVWANEEIADEDDGSHSIAEIVEIREVG